MVGLLPALLHSFLGHLPEIADKGHEAHCRPIELHGVPELVEQAVPGSLLGHASARGRPEGWMCVAHTVELGVWEAPSTVQRCSGCGIVFAEAGPESTSSLLPEPGVQANTECWLAVLLTEQTGVAESNAWEQQVRVSEEEECLHGRELMAGQERRVDARVGEEEQCRYPEAPRFSDQTMIQYVLLAASAAETAGAAEHDEVEPGVAEDGVGERAAKHTVPAAWA